MRRPPVHEWAVLGEDADPVPGDPDAVATLGGLLRDTADEIWRESGEVRTLASVKSWKSDAAERFRGAADDAVGGLHKAYHRYDVAARAMGTSVQEGSDGNWASALEQAQQMAAKALRGAPKPTIGPRRRNYAGCPPARRPPIRTRLVSGHARMTPLPRLPTPKANCRPPRTCTTVRPDTPPIASTARSPMTGCTTARGTRSAPTSARRSPTRATS